MRTIVVATALAVCAAIAPAHAADDSPMKAWMKEKLQPAKAKGDFAKIATMLDALAQKNPDAAAMPDWKKHCDAGTAAAKKQDKEGVNKSCTGCHNAYKKVFKEKYRSSAAP